MISKDCETTGVDMNHGARPFFFTCCDEDGEQVWWEADVNPATREPQWSQEDLVAFAEYCNQHDEWVYQNSKFDIKAETSAGINHPDGFWNRLQDTLLAGHLLASNQPHDLTTMALVYLGVNIQPYEDALEAAVQEARRVARSQFPNWRIARKDDPSMPSAKDKTWKYDTWLPRALAKELPLADDHEWWTVLRDYANTDSAVTLPLFKKQRQLLEQRGLWKLYLERLRLLPIAYKMEMDGVTLSRKRLEELRKDYGENSGKAGRLCVNLAASVGHELELPKGASPNNSIRTLMYDVFKVPPVYAKKSKTGNATLDKDAMAHYQATLPKGSKAELFVRTLVGKRSRDTALAYLAGYERFWLPLQDANGRAADWHVIHPSLNITGTDTLRWSSSNPNEQNISKKESFNLRYCFGPAPGREWWSLDAKNLELRIPAYESGERTMVDLFDRPDEPPYFGSYHLLIFDILHPKEFARHGVKCKDVYESTLYQWTKNGNFAVTYGAVEASGTADRAYHVPGAQRLIQSRLKDLAALNQKYIAYAKKNGYVETLPDKSVDAERGYPLLCSRSIWGQIVETVPFNYHVQGTAMWWMARAMVRCQAQLDEWNAEGFDGRIALQVHDELVFDFPKVGDPTKEQALNDVAKANCSPQVKRSNLWRVRKLQALMARGGDDLGVKTPVSAEWHAESWNKGVNI